MQKRQDRLDWQQVNDSRSEARQSRDWSRRSPPAPSRVRMRGVSWVPREFMAE